MRRPGSSLVSLSLLFCAAWAVASAMASASAQAQGPARRAKNAQPPGLSTEEIAVMLVSQEPEEVRMAIEAAGTAPRDTLTPLLVERIRAGLRPDLLLPALDAVAAAPGAEGVALLVALARHRQPEVRVRCLLALATLHAAEAQAALEQGLSDVAPDVRSAAAQGLALLGQKSAVPLLLRALEREVEGAADAVVALADAGSLAAIADSLERQSLLRLAPVLDGVLLKRSIADEPKLSLLARVAARDSGDARAYLEGLATRLPADASLQLRKTLSKLISGGKP